MCSHMTLEHLIYCIIDIDSCVCFDLNASFSAGRRMIKIKKWQTTRQKTTKRNTCTHKKLNSHNNAIGIINNSAYALAIRTRKIHGIE